MNPVRAKALPPPKGRPKGVPNKMTRLAKEAIELAFEGMGGVPALITWASANDDNRKAFYTQIFTKLLPVQVTGEGGGPLLTKLEVEFVPRSDT